MGIGGSLRLCLITVVSQPKLLVSVQPKLRNYMAVLVFVNQLKLTSLFWIVSILVLVQVSVVSIRIEICRTP